MPIKKIITKGKVPVKIYTDDIEQSAYEQLSKIAELPIIYPHIAAMPDVHCGVGATVGSVIPTKQAIIPAAVGVDIGCGMNAVRLSLRAEQLPDNLHRIRAAIEAVVPVGYNMHKKDMAKRSTLTALMGGLDTILSQHPKLTTGDPNRLQHMVSTLGDQSQTLIETYLTSATEMLAELKAPEATTPIQRLAHSLKSASAQMGASKLSDLCQQVESAGPSPQHATVKPIIEKMADEFIQVKAALLALNINPLNTDQ